MKNLLEYYYNIFPDVIYEKGNACYFFINDIKYYFVPFNRNINELNNLIELSNKLYFKGIKVHTFIETKEKKFYIEHEKINYVLLRVNTIENEEIDIYDIIKFNNLEIINDNKLDSLSWIKRWEHTADSFEREAIELNNDFPLLTNYFNYYIGLAENAISYVKNINLNEENKLYLSHKRIKTPLTYGMLYNPLSFIFDYKVRDLSEYIKELFFYSKFDEDEIFNIINEELLNYSLNDVQLLYGRLLFPTYYFDLFEGVLNKEREEKELNNIINLSKHYELFLKELYYVLKSKYNIEPIEWIVNNK